MTGGGLRLVLLRTRDAQNLGAVARALKNFAVRDWALVDPVTTDWETAARVAVQSEDVLREARRPASFDEAVGDCAWVVGTSSRARPGQRRLSPREFAQEARARTDAGERVALVLGDEQFGLSNEDIDRCHDLSVIGTDGAQPSVNLAQSALLYLYEFSCARPPRHPGPEPLRATDAELESLRAVLRDVLRGSGFLRGPERHAVRDLVEPLRRARLTRAEAGLWQAALHVISKRLGAG